MSIPGWIAGSFSLSSGSFAMELIAQAGDFDG